MGALFLFLLASPALPDYEQAAKSLAAHDLRGAEVSVTAALGKDAHYLPAIALKARLWMIDGRLQDARALLENAAANQRDGKTLLFLLGFCQYLQNDFEPAQKVFALSDQRDGRVLLYRALTEEGLNNQEAAVAFYERAMVLDSQSTEVRVAFARLLRKQGQTVRAETLIDEALRLAPQDRAVLYEKGQCLLARAEWRDAADTGERALRASGDAPAEREIRYLLIRAYLNAGETRKAAEHRNIFEQLPLPLVR